MATSWELPVVSDEQIHEVERAILRAFDSRSTDGLKIFGLGELGLALGWPTANPVAVFKRQAPGPDDQLDADMERMGIFHATLEAEGAPVMPTDVRIITNEHGNRIPYLIQPIVAAEDLVENILAEAEPSADHPCLVSIRDTIAQVVRDDERGGLSIDAQVTNFAWNGDHVVSIDTTPPLIWPADSGPMYEVGNYLTAVPRPLHPIAKMLTRKAGDTYRTPHGVLKMTAVYLLRIGQDRWVTDAITCFNDVLDDPIDRPMVDAEFAKMLKDLPTIKRLARLQRFWVTRVRKQRYEFFITNSFTGEIY